MRLSFTKIQTIGNDYLYFDFLKVQKPSGVDFGELSKKISDRRFGVGADGIVLIEKDKSNDCFMRIYNSDGSRGAMCGSALCGIVNYLSSSTSGEIYISTDSGVRAAKLEKDGKSRVQMGVPRFVGKTCVENLEFYKIGVGNNHFVHLCKKIPDNFETICKRVEKEFDVNIEFAQRVDERTFNVRVWERGSQETFACGTGAVAVSFVASKFFGIYQKNIAINLKGGNYLVEFEDEVAFLTGLAKQVFRGSIETDDYS